MLVTNSASRTSTGQTLTLQCPMGEECVIVRRGRTASLIQVCPRQSIIGPDPLQDLRQQHAAILVGMRAVAPEVTDLVAGAEFAVLVGLRIGIVEGREHLLVRQEPVAVLVREIVLAIL